jgi:sRNA-binding protein
MNKKWSSKKVKNIQDWLAKRWPAVFSAGPDRKPLALDIHKEILIHRSENPDLSRRALDEALKRHMSSHGYLYGMLKHSHRYDLSGEKLEPISPLHRKWAAEVLRKKQKEAQRARKAKKHAARAARRAKPPVATPARRAGAADQPVTDSPRKSGAVPVIRYKQRRRRAVESPAEVELAS